MITDFFEPRTPARSSALSKLARLKPPTASPPIVKNDRRENPSQYRDGAPSRVGAISRRMAGFRVASCICIYFDGSVRFVQGDHLNAEETQRCDTKSRTGHGWRGFDPEFGTLR